LSAPAFAIEKFQTNIGPTPLDGSNRVNVLGRGSVLATLDGSQFTVQGSFAGLATPATEAHLCMGNVMGGTGPAIGDVTVTQANDGKISGSGTLTPDQVAALKSGKIYVLLSSQKAAKGNLWAGSSRPTKPSARTCPSKAVGTFPTSCWMTPAKRSRRVSWPEGIDP